jgi:hypothetical protein
MVDRAGPILLQSGPTKSALMAMETKLMERMPPKKVFVYPKDKRKRL